jgi:hypothetical protein
MKNTVLLVEPRDDPFCILLLNQFIRVLGTEKWNYVFYFGKGTRDSWKILNPEVVELRELSVSNFEKAAKYNDFMKQRELWECLTGDFILTIQLDTWILENTGITIDHFIAMDRTIIGGNMAYQWNELDREQLWFSHLNLNGGLSLRKRADLIKVCNAYPPEPTMLLSNDIATDAEDVYFALGAYRLGLKIGNDEETSTFCLHCINKDNFFAMHQLYEDAAIDIEKRYPHLRSIHPYLFSKNLYLHYT